MKILNLVQQQPWAITEEMLDLINQVLYERYFGTIDIDSIETKTGKKLDNNFMPVIRKNIAVIPIHGVIAKRMNLFHEISGGVSTELIKKEIQSALNNPDIDAIVLDIDSPGGTVDGTKELSDFIYESKEKKPILAHANGLMASAAYWIGSAANKITAYDTAQIGSIGVLAAHYDFSKRDEMQGIKRTYLYSGKYKAIGNDAEPLSKDAKDYFQKQLDDIYTIFVDSIARNRDAEVNKVLSDMAEGKMFLAGEAKNIGMIDHIMNLDDTIELAAKMADGEDIEEEGENKKAETEYLEYEAPYPGEHSCRLRPPNYPKYSRVNCDRKSNNKCIDVIYGIKGPNKSEEQAYRYDKDIWTASDARSHCEKHNGTFEAARSDKKSSSENKLSDLNDKVDALLKRHILK